MRFKAGDRIEVTINTLGVAPRRGAVLESTSAGGIQVLWDDGHQSVFMPGSNCQLVASFVFGVTCMAAYPNEFNQVQFA